MFLVACGPNGTDDICGARAACTAHPGEAPDGGLQGYVFCTNASSTQAWFQATNGKRYDCISPSDCRVAFQAVTDWCRGP